MAKRHKELARHMRALLFEALGRICVECGATENLTFDCIESRGDAHHRYDTHRRMVFYFREWKQGNIQVLCHKCNSKKQAKEPECPF